MSPPSSGFNKPSKNPGKVATEVIGWLEILDYTGSRLEMGLVSIGSLWDRKNCCALT
jgi:hypothetical protein